MNDTHNICIICILYCKIDVLLRESTIIFIMEVIPFFTFIQFESNGIPFTKTHFKTKQL